RFEFVEMGRNMRENAGGFIIRAENEIAAMTALANKMFSRIRAGLVNMNSAFIDEHIEKLSGEEDYLDQMREQLTRCLLRCYDLPLSDAARHNIPHLLRIVEELERMSDDCYVFAMLMKKSIEKQMSFEKEDIDLLVPYSALAAEFLDFIEANINTHLDSDGLQKARALENKIDESRTALKALATRRLESGVNVKQELLYIDLVRNIERIGDCAFSISRALSCLE
ncbi:MAG: Na/Pi cotransporter family protein, partial [Treponema sp.]|nr:Na/Pi cotransporter family protein [Treponema sp.]